MSDEEKNTLKELLLKMKEKYSEVFCQCMATDCIDQLIEFIEEEA